MILAADGRETRRGMDPCPRCGNDEDRKLVTAFGGFWSLHCSHCQTKILTGRGNPPIGFEEVGS